MRISVLTVCLALSAAPASAATTISHGRSVYGDLKYPSDFTQLDYVNPDAPKGGELVMNSIGSFDTLNPFVVRGEFAAGAGAIYDSLLTRTPDEGDSIDYGLIAKTMEWPDDLSWVQFEMRPEARWHDGTPLTADDVAFSLGILKEKGAPMYRHYYANVEKAEVLGPNTIKFHFSGPKNRELPNIIGEMQVLPKHYWKDRDFERATLEPPLGSGPYRIGKVDPGRSITIERVADHWARNHPLVRGRYNFDIRYEYFRDATVALEAFKAHQYDFRAENVAKNWALGYDSPALRAGLYLKEELPSARVAGMQGFVFNTRRPLFQDRRVRLAIALTFDFDWVNKNLFYSQYSRTNSYFDNSELGATGLPSAEELKLLEPHRDKLPPEVFTELYQAPRSDGSGQDRNNLRRARELLEQAGWTLRDGKLVDKEGKPFDFEFLMVQPEFERIVATMQKPLERLGITLRMRTVDSAQYQNRLREFDFDMTVGSFGQSHSPGNEQREFWSAAAAERRGGRNIIGIKDAAIDALVEQVIAADSRPALIASTRALDRVLTWGHYVVPNYHSRVDRVAYWNRLSRPAVLPKYRVDLASWWIDPAKDAALKRGESSLKPQ